MIKTNTSQLLTFCFGSIFFLHAYEKSLLMLSTRSNKNPNEGIYKNFSDIRLPLGIILATGSSETKNQNTAKEKSLYRLNKIIAAATNPTRINAENKNDGLVIDW